MNLDMFVNKSPMLQSNSDRIGLEALLKVGLTTNKTVYKDYLSGYYSSGKFDHKAFSEKMGLMLLLNEENNIFLYVSEDAVMEVDASDPDNYMSIFFISLNDKKNKLFQATKKMFIEKLDNTGKIYCIVQNGSNLSLSSIGKAGIPFNEKNYSKKVVSDYKFILKDLKAKNPCGRISIFEGIPGSGKTHLVKSLLNDINDTMFILVPPELVKQLAGPQFVPLLISYTSHTKGPVILILEDADECLVKRDSSNINSIQALLNLSDGIIGSMLDLRIVATTNATKIDFEPAILRNGRLSKRIEVNLLTATEANNLLSHLFSTKFNIKSKKSNNKKVKSFSFTKPVVLADVYAKARDLGWCP